MTTPTTTAAKKTRVVRTPAQVAVDRLDAARARLVRAKDAAKRATEVQNAATKARNAALAEEQAAQAAVDFEAKHPDLPNGNQSAVTSVQASPDVLKGVQR